ncbi:hypothetical protein [Pseudomonas protegens]
MNRHSSKTASGDPGQVANTSSERGRRARNGDDPPVQPMLGRAMYR